MSESVYMTLPLLIYEEYSSVMHGNQRYIVLMMEHISRNIFEPHVVTLSPGALLEHVKPFASASSLDDQVHAGLFRRLVRLRAVLADIKPGVVLCNNERSLLIVWLAGLFLGLRFVWYIKNARVFWLTDIIGALVAARIFVISEAMPKRKGPIFRWLARKKSLLLPIGTLLDDFVSIPEIGVHKGKLKVLMLAAVIPAKGIETAVDAVRTAQEKGLDLELRIAGAAPKKWQAFVSEMHRKAEGSPVGWLEWQADVIPLLEWADVVILPSFSEGVPRSLVEAMAAGRPVVASRVGGIPSLVQDGVTGMLIEAGDAQGLADALAALADDPDGRRRMGMAARAYAVEHHDFAAHLRSLEQHLAEVAR